MPEPRTMHPAGLAQELKLRLENESDIQIAFLLGAGASIESGAPTTDEMVREWIAEIYTQRTGKTNSDESIKWFAKNNLVPGFDISYPSASYSAIFDVRFEHGTDPGGFQYLERKIDGKSPSVGYYVLAMMTHNRQARLVLTTNFDNLVVDAITAISPSSPLVCTHESLAGYIHDTPRRPTVVKLHRDLLLEPQNTQEGTRRLAPGLAKVVTNLCQKYTLVVVGYDGNDGSLMDVLDGLPEPPASKMMFWCRYKGTKDKPAPPPSDRIKSLVAKRKGYLVDHDGFDKLMVEIAKWLKTCGEDIDQAISERAKTRLTAIQGKFSILSKIEADSDEMASPEQKEAVAAFVAPQKQNKSWWQWQNEIDAETDLDRQDNLFNQAILDLPNSKELLVSYANFLCDIRKDYDKADEMYRRTLVADPEYALALYNYAIFLDDIRKDHNGAEEMYSRAIEADPKFIKALGNYANLLSDNRKDYDRAEEMYNRALEADPKYAKALSNYANFLNYVRKDYARAEDMYKRALETDPKYANALGNYAKLLFELGRDGEAFQKLTQAKEANASRPPWSLNVELAMYEFLMSPEELPRKQAVKDLKSLIYKNKIRTDDWDFSKLIEIATSRNHPEAAWLPKLAEVLADKASPDTLSEWPAFQAA